MNNNQNLETAILGAGCFWCTEAAFSRIKGVVSVEPGYSGGHKENPTYEEVCTGTTGHAEVAKIIFDSDVVSFKEILDVFWTIHDPTSLNRQGEDVGEQYRSVIFYTNEAQKKIAEEEIARLEKEKIFDKKIVTAIEPLKNFYPAEDYHKNYFENHKDKPYCQFVIAPKVKKVEARFAEMLKEK